MTTDEYRNAFDVIAERLGFTRAGERYVYSVPPYTKNGQLELWSEGYALDRYRGYHVVRWRLFGIDREHVPALMALHDATGPDALPVRFGEWDCRMPGTRAEDKHQSGYLSGSVDDTRGT